MPKETVGGGGGVGAMISLSVFPTLTKIIRRIIERAIIADHLAILFVKEVAWLKVSMS